MKELLWEDCVLHSWKYISMYLRNVDNVSLSVLYFCLKFEVVFICSMEDFQVERLYMQHASKLLFVISLREQICERHSVK